MANEIYPTSRAALEKIISPLNYYIKSTKAILSGVNTSAEAVITGQSKRFWITEIKLVLLTADGKLFSSYDTNTVMAWDDILVGVSVSGVEMTDQPIPLLLLNTTNNELFAGKILEPNEQIRFTFYSKSHSGTGNMSYPLQVRAVVKGYDLPIYQ